MHTELREFIEFIDREAEYEKMVSEDEKATKYLEKHPSEIKKRLIINNGIYDVNIDYLKNIRPVICSLEKKSSISTDVETYYSMIYYSNGHYISNRIRNAFLLSSDVDIHTIKRIVYDSKKKVDFEYYTISDVYTNNTINKKISKLVDDISSIQEICIEMIELLIKNDIKQFLMIFNQTQEIINKLVAYFGKILDKFSMTNMSMIASIKTIESVTKDTQSRKMYISIIRGSNWNLLSKYSEKYFLDLVNKFDGRKLS
mgnify:FL=1